MNTPAIPAPATSSRSLWTDPVFWFVMALGFAFGFFYNFLPVSFPAFKESFSANLEQLGRTQFLYALAGLILCLAGGWIFGKLGLATGAVASAVALALSLALIGAAPVLSLIFVGAAGLGIAVYANYVVSSAILSDCYPERRQSAFFLYGVIDGAGAVMGPAALGWWIGHAQKTGGSWRWGYGGAVALAAILVVWGLLVHGRIKSATAKAALASSSTPWGAMKHVITKPAIYGIGLAFLLHGLAQVGMVSWVGQLYQKKLGIDVTRAALLISFNSAGFFAGRSLLTWVTAKWKIPELVVLGCSAAGGTLAFMATLAAPSYVWGIIMFTIAGAFISGDAPAMMSFTGARFPGHSAAAFSLMTAIGTIGSAIGPYLTGALGQKFGLEKAIWLMPMFSLALAALAFIWFFLARKSQPSGA